MLSTNLWEQIIDGVIKNFSPIIAAFIAAIIAGVSACLTWKSYKNSHDATPPELLKYEKWLDIMKKRKEVLDKMPRDIKEDKFPINREKSFARTLELYERSAIWEGEVISATPMGIYRKYLLRFDPQLALGENILSPRQFPRIRLVSSIGPAILMLVSIIVSSLSLIICLIGVVYWGINGFDYESIIIELFFLINTLRGIVSFIVSICILDIKVLISALYYYKIRRQAPLKFPSFISILSRELYMINKPNNQLFPLLKCGSIKATLRSIFGFGFLCAYASGATLQVREVYMAFKNLKIDVSSLMISSVIFVYIATYITYVYIKNEFFSHDILGECELILLNGKWKFFYRENEYTVSIKDGEVNVKKINGNAEQSIGDKKLSMHDMKRVIKGKPVIISKDNGMAIIGDSSSEIFNLKTLIWSGQEMILMRN